MNWRATAGRLCDGVHVLLPQGFDQVPNRSLVHSFDSAQAKGSVTRSTHGTQETDRGSAVGDENIRFATGKLTRRPDDVNAALLKVMSNLNPKFLQGRDHDAGVFAVEHTPQR